jgi:hypothetical protein
MPEVSVIVGSPNVMVERFVQFAKDYSRCLIPKGKSASSLEEIIRVLNYPFDSRKITDSYLKVTVFRSMTQYQETLCRIRETDKRLLQIFEDKSIYAELPSYYLQDFLTFSPWNHPPESMADTTANSFFAQLADFREICSQNSVHFLCRLVESRLNDISRIIDWTLNRAPLPPKGVALKKDIKTYPLGTIPIERLQVILIKDSENRFMIRLFKSEGEPEDFELSELGLINRKTGAATVKAWETLLKIAEASGEPVELDRSDVRDLNARLKHILHINYQSIVCVGCGRYKPLFQCRIA